MKVPLAKKNYLLESVRNIFTETKKGKVLDLGCGDGDYSLMLKNLGFEVMAADLDEGRFKHKNEIRFQKCDLTQKLAFIDYSFDYILLLEVIEHLKNPYSVMQELNRVIKDSGILILSTPNILSLKSRFRFLFEGTFRYFREPPIDQALNPKEAIFNLHIYPYRFQELEYLLWQNGFKIEKISTSIYEGFEYFFLLPVIKLQQFLRKRRSKTKESINYSRINKILSSKELLFGRHLILKCVKFKNE